MAEQFSIEAEEERFDLLRWLWLDIYRRRPLFRLATKVGILNAEALGYCRRPVRPYVRAARFGPDTE
jgi:hypothetical protein